MKVKGVKAEVEAEAGVSQRTEQQLRGSVSFAQRTTARHSDAVADEQNRQGKLARLDQQEGLRVAALERKYDGSDRAVREKAGILKVS